MKRIFLSLLGVLVLQACSTTKTTNETSDVAVIPLGSGICGVTVTNAFYMKNAPSKIHYESSDFKLIEKTNKIPAFLGQRFGTDFIVKAEEYKKIPVDIVWTYPAPITNSEGKTYKTLKYQENIPTNKNFHTTYALNEDYLVVKGDWKYQMFYKGRKIYENKFRLQ